MRMTRRGMIRAGISAAGAVLAGTLPATAGEKKLLPLCPAPTAASAIQPGPDATQRIRELAEKVSANGGGDVRLAPGEYVLEEPLDLQGLANLRIVFPSGARLKPGFDPELDADEPLNALVRLLPVELPGETVLGTTARPGSTRLVAKDPIA